MHRDLAENATLKHQWQTYLRRRFTQLRWSYVILTLALIGVLVFEVSVTRFAGFLIDHPQTLKAHLQEHPWLPIAVSFLGILTYFALSFAVRNGFGKIAATDIQNIRNLLWQPLEANQTTDLDKKQYYALAMQDANIVAATTSSLPLMILQAFFSLVCT